ncbi:MAG: GNAT family N-acetyltransferase, partial [Cohnella sp.]|nr:GNAT family N-acetyltransferase [Cohnella sp.]
MVESGGEIIASLPYYRTKKYGCDMIRMPKLTPAMGVWIRYPSDQKYATRLAYEKETFTKLIDHLPDFDSFYQHFNWTLTNWMPFHWRGFTQSTDYTYLLEDTSDLDAVFAGFRENIRREIRKAQKQLTVEQSEDIAKFYEVQSKTYQRQNLKMPYSFEFLKKLDDACKSRGCRAMWFASDSLGQVHSVIYVVWDRNYVYYLM